MTNTKKSKMVDERALIERYVKSAARQKGENWSSEDVSRMTDTFKEIPYTGSMKADKVFSVVEKIIEFALEFGPLFVELFRKIKDHRERAMNRKMKDEYMLPEDDYRDEPEPELNQNFSDENLAKISRKGNYQDTKQWLPGPSRRQFGNGKGLDDMIAKTQSKEKAKKNALTNQIVRKKVLKKK